MDAHVLLTLVLLFGWEPMGRDGSPGLVLGAWQSQHLCREEALQSFTARGVSVSTSPVCSLAAASPGYQKSSCKGDQMEMWWSHSQVSQQTICWKYKDSMFHFPKSRANLTFWYLWTKKGFASKHLISFHSS